MFNPGDVRSRIQQYEPRMNDVQQRGDVLNRPSPSERVPSVQQSAMHNERAVESNSRREIASPHVLVSPSPPPTNAPPPIPQESSAASRSSLLLRDPRDGTLPAHAEQSRGHSLPAIDPGIDHTNRRPRPSSPSATSGTSSARLTEEGGSAQGSWWLGASTPTQYLRATPRYISRGPGASMLHAAPLGESGHQKSSRGGEPSAMRTVSGHVRSLTAPPTLNRQQISALRRTIRNAASSHGSSHRLGARSKVEERGRSNDDRKGYHPLASVSVRSAPWAGDELGRLRRRTSAVAKASGPSSTHKRSHQWRTMRTSIDTGPSLSKELVPGHMDAGNRSRYPKMYRVNLPPRLSFIDKELPGTPDMVPQSATELLPRSPTTSQESELLKSRRSGIIGRSPLSQISQDHGRAQNVGHPIAFASGLTALSEDLITNDKMSSEVDPAIPTATQIHLRGGSVVTVTPPEMTAWRRSTYLHGPIRLPKPVIAPRKNSVASLEAFQDVVDDLYQQSLAIPRRSSDDAVSEDICDFFDDFGFDAVSFDGDILAKPPVKLDMLEEEDADSARSGTLDGEASPVEVVIAKEVLERMNRLQSIHTPSVPPMETEETLRARGIARLSRASAKSAASDDATRGKESLNVGGPEGIPQSSLLPAPEDEMFHVDPMRLQQSRKASVNTKGAASTRPAMGRFLDEDDIQEMSVSPTWASPASAAKNALNKGMSTRRPRNPIDRIRRRARRHTKALMFSCWRVIGARGRRSVRQKRARRAVAADVGVQESAWGTTESPGCVVQHGPGFLPRSPPHFWHSLPKLHLDALHLWHPPTDWLGALDGWSDTTFDAAPALLHLNNTAPDAHAAATVPRTLHQYHARLATPGLVAATTASGPCDERRSTPTIPSAAASRRRFSVGLPASSPQPTSSLAHDARTSRKRDIHHVDMMHSTSYTYGTTPCRPVHSSPSPQTHVDVDHVQVYDPADYCSKLSSVYEIEPAQSAAKRPRVDCFDASQWTPQPLFASNLCPPSAHDISPSTSISTHLSPSSHAASAAMSRQSSVTSVSVTDAFDMMRVESSFSTHPHLFPLDDLSVSCSTEKPPVSAQPTIVADDSSASHLLSNVGYALVGTDFSLFDHSISDVPVGGQQRTHSTTHVEEAQGMDSILSEPQQDGCENTGSEQRGHERRRKHIENARQSIASKDVTTSKPTTPGNRAAAKQESGVKRKEAIPKAPYVRPQHSKLKCSMCDEFPSGFRGDHELRRHWERAHAECRKVWICTEPTVRTEWWPTKPLGICKQCKQQKNYSAYYNAAAHLRRAHFCPRKRGRKARGEERESRAGKAGGDWPPIEWLKANGWLKEIEVSSKQEALEDLEGPESTSHEAPDEELIYTTNTQAPNTASEPFGIPNYPAVTDFSLGYPTPIDSTIPWPIARAMEHTISAPATFAAMTPVYTPDDFTMMHQQHCMF
ncbi:hypothetical protein BST61_g9037 [Cercospora zeina]